MGWIRVIGEVKGVERGLRVREVGGRRGRKRGVEVGRMMDEFGE